LNRHYLPVRIDRLRCEDCRCQQGVGEDRPIGSCGFRHLPDLPIARCRHYADSAGAHAAVAYHHDRMGVIHLPEIMRPMNIQRLQC
jgi:hypothetical protein